MQICRTIAALRAALSDAPSIGLVGTQGGFHAGHRALIDAARADHPVVVASVFVIPANMGGPRDIDVSARDETADFAFLKDANVDIVFVPKADEIYPKTDETIVEVTRTGNAMSGQHHAGYFRAITTLYARLFNITGAHGAYFGEKHYQQLQIIRRMVHDLHMPVHIHGVATVRDVDGLALSSRNQSLSDEDRAAAVCLSKAMDAARNVATSGVPIDRIDQALRSTINREPRARLRAVDIVNTDTFEPATGQLNGPIAIMVSAEFSGLLLVDQCEIVP